MILGFVGKIVPFLFLTLEPPPTPLFAKDEKTTIPQVPLVDMLERFDGKSCHVILESYLLLGV